MTLTTKTLNSLTDVITTLLIVVLAMTQSQAQNKHNNSKHDSLFFIGINSIDIKDYSKAIHYLNDFVSKADSSENYGEGLFSLAETYYDIDSIDLAVHWFKKILTTTLNDSVKCNINRRFKSFTNYKYLSTRKLGIIHFDNQDYQEAIKYFHYALYKYPGLGFSNSEASYNELRRYTSSCYLSIEQYDSALFEILPAALGSYGSSRSHEPSFIALQIINKHLDKEDTRKKISEAIESINYNSNSDTYHTTFMNRKLTLNPMHIEQNHIETFQKIIRTTELWKRLISPSK